MQKKLRTLARITIETPNTLLLGVYVQDGRAAITATLRNQSGELQAGVFEGTGQALPALARALVELEAVGADNMLLLTNSEALHTILSYPHRYNNEHPKTWPQSYWRILYESTKYCLHGRWKVQLVDDLPKARELWQAQALQRNTTE